MCVLFVYLHVHQFYVKKNDAFYHEIEYTNRDKFEEYCRQKYPVHCKMKYTMPYTDDLLRPPFTVNSHTQVFKNTDKIDKHNVLSRKHLKIYRGTCSVELYAPEKDIFIDDKKIDNTLKIEMKENELLMIPAFWYFKISNTSEDIDGKVSYHNTIMTYILNTIQKIYNEYGRYIQIEY